MTDRDLLEVATRNYRDLTEAVAAMWEHVQPYLVPGTVPDFDHSQTQPSPVGDIELMTRAVIESLRRNEPRQKAGLEIDPLHLIAGRATVEAPTCGLDG
jgi:hypothetical protein